MKVIIYPYIPSGRSIQYVSAEDRFMQAAREYALANSLDEAVKTGSVVVKNDMIVGQGANGSRYHSENVCERVKLGIPTGERYELCEGCHPKNHSEPRAIADAKDRGFNLADADLYLWGHWWACESCWSKIAAAGITNVYLLENSENLFNKSHPGNILGDWD